MITFDICRMGFDNCRMGSDVWKMSIDICRMDFDLCQMGFDLCQICCDLCWVGFRRLCRPRLKSDKLKYNIYLKCLVVLKKIFVSFKLALITALLSVWALYYDKYWHDIF